jgi:hypothetical protein
LATSKDVFAFEILLSSKQLALKKTKKQKKTNNTNLGPCSNELKPTIGYQPHDNVRYFELATTSFIFLITSLCEHSTITQPTK